MPPVPCALRGRGVGVDRLAPTATGDLHLAGLGLLGHRDRQGEHPVVVVRFKMIDVEGLAQEQLAAERALWAQSGVTSRPGCASKGIRRAIICCADRASGDRR